MFLFKNDIIANATTIRGTRYITVSMYGGDRDIFQKIGDLITESYNSVSLRNTSSESLSNVDMDIQKR